MRGSWRFWLLSPPLAPGGPWCQRWGRIIPLWPPLVLHPNLDTLCLSSLMGGVFLPGGGVVLEADYLQVVLMEQ